MLKNDRMMMILTGLVLAIFAGSMVKYGDRIMGLMSGADVVVSQDDSFSVRAGSAQVLDVLSNDTVKGQIVVLSRPSCGAIELTGNNKISFSSDESCQGQVEFAYCVDSEGSCTPNSVKVNVISVSYAQNGTTETASTPVRIPQNNAEEIVAPPGVDQNAPEIENFAVEMAPPMLASPSMSELISPSVAMASIRQSSGGLNQAENLDENIATQNSAGVSQTATAAPTVFAAPEMGESSGILLGTSSPVIASNPTTPSSLQATSGSDIALATIERGPEALASLQSAQLAPVTSESAPLSANPERTNFTPGNPPNVQSASAQPEATFSATPAGTGPIALVALNPTSSGNASGESLNVILTEPGLQSFAATPSALAPASPSPDAVSLLEHAPNVASATDAPLALRGETAVGVVYTSANEPATSQTDPTAPSIGSTTTTAPNQTNATGAAPVQVVVASEITRTDTVSSFIIASRTIDAATPSTSIQPLADTNAAATPKPSINLTPPSVQQASLETPATPPAGAAPAQNSTCNIGLTTNASRGANISVDILAACKPNQLVTIQHSGLAFSLLTDAQGAAHTVVPAMAAYADISVVFEDGSQAIASLAVSDMDSILRVGVSWANTMNLDLNAIEFGAAAGSEGRVSATAPRDYRTSRIKGGGYLVQLGDPTLAGGQLAEVYTIPVARGQQRGTIALSVILDNPATVCGQSILAKTVRSREGQSASVRNVRFTVPACGNLSSQIELRGAVNDIRLAGR